MAMRDFNDGDMHNGGDSGESPNSLPSLNLPAVRMRTTVDKGLLKVFDPLRDKFVTLTPEEYVRRHFTEYMMCQLHYPKSLMANEVGISVNGCARRCDTVIYNPDGSLLMIIEYKAPDVRVTQEVFDQIARYNLALKARYLVVSNGLRHYCCVIDYQTGSYHFIPRIPDYLDMRNPHSEN